jgi:hypothetical protein
MQQCSRLVLFGIVLSGMAPLSAYASDRTYLGFCEASAAVRIDQTHVAVASDDYDSIQLYERGKPDRTSELQLGDVTDVEAGARIGDTVFWLTSYSLNKDGEDKKKRKVLFATKVSADGRLADTGAVYRKLRADLAVKLGRTDDEVKTAFNIEGMTDTPEGHLLVGLRGPRSDEGQKAILFEVANPSALVGLQPGEGGPANITRVVTLDLSDGPGTTGRGVRDIARVGGRYLIVAGAEPDGGIPPSKLFWWDGKSDKVSPGPEADFSGMTPEAIVVWNDHEAEVFSDDGGKPVNRAECKDKNPPPGASFQSVDVKF